MFKVRRDGGSGKSRAARGHAFSTHPATAVIRTFRCASFWLAAGLLPWFTTQCPISTRDTLEVTNEGKNGFRQSCLRDFLPASSPRRTHDGELSPDSSRVRRKAGE